MNLIEELRWRGLLQDMMPGTEEILTKEKVVGYAGFDPTADSLTIGNMVPVMLLMHLQKAGHKPIALVGGATGMIGDPSGKSEERSLLSIEQINHNLAGIQKQLEKFLDFDSTENAAEVVNNYTWFKDFSFLDFIRDVGKHITISYMISKDSVKNRLESGMSFTEFTYQLVQGYDFYWLNQHKNCKLQMGGSDQWGNIVTGTELIRRKGGKEAFALTAPLITKSDGTKFGKSEGNNVWLDRNKTTPYQFYQFWLNISDEEAKKFIKIFTLKSQSDIEALVIEHDAAPHLRILQKALAYEFTTRVHSANDTEKAIQVTNLLFGNAGKEDVMKLTAADWAEMDGVPRYELKKEALVEEVSLIDFLSDRTGIFASKGEAKRNLSENSISINKEKVTVEQKLAVEFLLCNKYILVQKGKRNYYLVETI